MQVLVAYIPLVNLQDEPFTIGAQEVAFEMRQLPLAAHFLSHRLPASISLFRNYEVPYGTTDKLFPLQTKQLAFGLICKNDLTSQVDLMACHWHLGEELIMFLLG